MSPGITLATRGGVPTPANVYPETVLTVPSTDTMNSDAAVTIDNDTPLSSALGGVVSVSVVALTDSDAEADAGSLACLAL